MTLEAKIYTDKGVVQGQVVRASEMVTGKAYVQYTVEHVNGAPSQLYLPDPGSREALRSIQDITINQLDL